jgi:hypothetical protein
MRLLFKSHEIAQVHCREEPEQDGKQRPECGAGEEQAGRWEEGAEFREISQKVRTG